MRQIIIHGVVGLVCISQLTNPVNAVAQDQELAREVLTAIERAQKLIVSEQSGDGTFAPQGERYRVGVTSLALLALISSGMTVQDAPVQKALQYLRSLPAGQPALTYELSMAIMALTAINDPARDGGRISYMASRLEALQVRNGESAGLWSYSSPRGGDRSNGQFAVLGLRDAAKMGYPVDRRTWELIKRHWELGQNPDGGWGYTNRDGTSTGSMTVAGVATLRICETMLRDDKQLNADGTPICCPEPEKNTPLDRGIRWIADRFTVGHNPNGKGWNLYYLYGLERAGRLNGLRFFGEHDWYRAGARSLVDRQSIRGTVQGANGYEAKPVVGTSLALLFLSKGFVTGSDQ